MRTCPASVLALIIISGTLALLTGHSPPALATVWTVNPDGSADFVTIQGGLDAAVSGDSVEVSSATYTGDDNKNLDFLGKDLVLFSLSGPAVTVIDCEGSGRGLLFDDGEAGAAIVDGFTIRNGFIDDSDPWGGGGAILCLDASPTIRNCVLSGNSVMFEGGAVYVDGGSPVFSACVVTDNSAEDAGGGFFLAGDGAPQLIDCTIAGNVASVGGGGVMTFSSASASLLRCLIAGNAVTGHYGGGGIYGGLDTSTTLVGSTVSGNSSAGVTSYGIYVDSASMTIERSILWGNCGYELKADGSSSVEFVCCAIDPAEVVGLGSIVYDGEQVADDPLFCGAEPCESAPTVAGEYGLSAASPCLPSASPCGELIGALGEGCASSTLPEAPGVVGSAELDGLFLSRPLPNPASDLVRFSVDLPRGTIAQIQIFDARGRLVETIANQQQLGPGRTDFSWRGDGLPSGSYYVRLQLPGRMISRGIVLIR